MDNLLWAEQVTLDGVRAYKRTSTNLKQATSNVRNSGKQEKIEDDCKELDSP